MNAGRLRFKFLVQNSRPTSFTAAGHDPGWTDDGEIWADIEGLGSRERFYAAQSGSTANHRITTRWTDSIGNRSRLVLDPGAPGSGAKADRVIEGSRVFYVDSTVDQDGRRRWLVLNATERTA